MAYQKNTYGKATFRTNTRYPKSLSKRESRVIQTTIDTVLADAISISAAYTVTDEIKSILTNATLTLTFPSAVLFPGRQLTVYAVTANAVTLAATAGTVEEPTEGVPDAVGDNATWISDGTNWKLISDNVAA